FLLKVENGCITVYDKESGEVFEHTNIPLETLPQELQAEVLLGKTLSGDQELYSFLENYSSLRCEKFQAYCICTDDPDLSWSYSAVWAWSAAATRSPKSSSSP